MTHIHIVPVLSDNYSYLLNTGHQAISIDPGESAPVEGALSELGLMLRAIVLTHTHHDHIGGVAALQAAHNCPVFAPQGDTLHAPFTPLVDGENASIAGIEMRVISTPGHCKPHIALLSGNALFAGDVLLTGGCGRILDGSPAELWQSLLKLRALPPETQIYCGHNYTVTNLEFGLQILPEDPAMLQALKTAQERDSTGAPHVPARLQDECRYNVFLRSDDPVVASALDMPTSDSLTVFTALRQRKNRW